MIVIAIDTTGFIDNPPGWIPKVVAVGVAVVDDPSLTVTHADGLYVCPPQEHLYHAAAESAFESNGLEPDAVMAWGKDEAEAVLLVHGIIGSSPLACFGMGFTYRFVGPPPWRMSMMTHDIMELAALRWGKGNSRRISRSDAQGAATHAGYDVEMGDFSHRIPTVEKCYLDAKLWCAVERERLGR